MGLSARGSPRREGAGKIGRSELSYQSAGAARGGRSRASQRMRARAGNCGRALPHRRARGFAAADDHTSRTLGCGENGYLLRSWAPCI